MTERKVRVLQVGMGPIGRGVTRELVDRDGIEIIGAIDLDRALIGKDIGELAGGAAIGRVVVASVEEALGDRIADVAAITTTSSVDRLADQIAPFIGRGLNVVSSCEELACPFESRPEAAEKIDRLARESDVTVLGTGINPGFLMDLLPVVLTGPCRRVDRIEIERIQDATPRRLPFREKIGARLTPTEFDGRVAAGTLRHVGLTESMHMIARRLGWTLDRTEDVISPVIADVARGEGETHVEAGRCAGVEQIGRGFVGDREVLHLVFRATIGEETPRDAVHVVGEPSFRAEIAGGIDGDVGTCAIMANAVMSIGEAPAGLRTMADMPPVAWRA